MGALLPAMTQEKLDTQRDVVKNERRWSVDNQPYGTWWERLPALCFPPEHPFHHSLIGSMEHLSEASLEDIADFFRTWYSPDNAVLTIAGDFDPAEARALVERYFGPIPKGGARPVLASFAVPPTFGGAKREVVKDDVVLPRLFLAFRSPVFGSEEYYAASVCGAVLGMRRGSRLYRALVREQEVAQEVSAFTYDLAKGSDLLVVDAMARPGVSLERLEAAVGAEVDRLHADGVTAADVARALALIETELVAALQSAGERADKLSQFATYFGDPAVLNHQLDRYRGVTAAQVTAFARARLGADNRASLIFVPRAASAAAAAATAAVEVGA
jgi:predicted Zn-dependent peptidase